MKTRNARWAALTALIAGLTMASSAQAYWALDTTPTNTVTGSVAGEGTVTMSGFYVSNTLNGSNLLSGTWAAGTLQQYSGNGQGMSTGSDNGSPYHALDNNQNTEGVLLSFSTSTVLTSIGLGYTATTSAAEYGCKNTTTGAMTVTSGSCGAGTTNVGQTADLSVFRWVGSGTPTGGQALTSTVAGTMSGWELVGNYGDMVLDTDNPYNLVNSAGKTSSYWLITAYNSGYTQSSGVENRSTLTNGDDFFKLYAAAGTKCSTNLVNGVCGGTSVGKLPEPASLALSGIALVGVAGLRRRKAKQA